MPFSDGEGKDLVKVWIDDLGDEIKTVLDVGPGAGTYADLLRRKGQIWSAVEVWGPYIQQFNLSSKYHRIYVGDVTIVDESFLSGYDLVILGDVIEHMPKIISEPFLDNLLTWFRNKYVLIAFPTLHMEQGAWEGNTFETHVDHWSHSEMLEFFAEIESIDVVCELAGDTLSYFLVRCYGDNKKNL